MAYTSTSLFILEGCQELKTETGAEAMKEVLLTGLLLVAGSACFLIQLGTTSLEMAPSLEGWAFPYQSFMEKMPYRLAYRPI